jgi:hypothetical protein
LIEARDLNPYTLLKGKGKYKTFTLSLFPTSARSLILIGVNIGVFILFKNAPGSV